jgi:hypothetical protein
MSFLPPLPGHCGRRSLNSLPLHSPQRQPWKTLSSVHVRTEVARGYINGLLSGAPNLSLSLLPARSELDQDMQRKLTAVRHAGRVRGEYAGDQLSMTDGAV